MFTSIVVSLGLEDTGAARRRWWRRWRCLADCRVAHAESAAGRDDACARRPRETDGRRDIPRGASIRHVDDSGCAASGRIGRRLHRVFVAVVTAADLQTGPDVAVPVTDADIAGTDEPVQRYVRFMGVVGRPRVWSFAARFAGRFRLRPARPGCQPRPPITSSTSSPVASSPLPVRSVGTNLRVTGGPPTTRS